MRYRIYSTLGLDAYDVAAIATFASLAFGIGVTLIGLASLAAHPLALSGVIAVDPVTVRWASLAVLLALILVLGVLATRRSAIRIAQFEVRMPSPAILLGQVGFTVIDLALSATTLFVLLPSSDLGFFTFLAVFAAATMTGVLSHVPGGVGVFESIVIAALPATVPLEQAAAALLLYRLIYYLLPFGLAVILLAATEAATASKAVHGPVARVAQLTRPLRGAASAVAPLAIAVLVFGSGLWMLFSALIPNMSASADELELFLPLVFVEGGALLSSAIGVVLLILSHGLVRRMDGAYWMTILALGVGIIAAIAHGIDYDRATLLLFVAAILWPCRREFHRQARITRAMFAPGWIALVAATVIASGFLLFFAHKNTAYAQELWWQFAVDESAPRAMRAGMVASLAVVAGLVFFALRPLRHTPAEPTSEDLALAAKIIAEQDNADANLVHSGDKALMFSTDRRAFQMYAVQRRSWIAFGDPIGSEEAFEELAWAFADAARSAGARPVFCEVSDDHLPLWLEIGLTLHKMGEEAVLDLARFDLEGSSRKRLRAAHNRAKRDGLTLEIAEPPHAPTLLSTLRTISDAWLAAKKSREKGFSVGRFDPAYPQHFPVATVCCNGKIVAFANLMTTATRRMVTIDLMRHVDDAPGGTMDFLFIDLMLTLKSQGYQEFGLGMAPLSGLEARKGASLWTQVGAQIYRHGGQFYNFEGLRQFKEKFEPEWRPRYLACPGALPPLVPLADATSLISGGGANASIRTG